MTLLFAPPTELFIELPPDRRQPAQYSGYPNRDRWQANLNQRCLDAVLAWMQEEEAPEAQADPHWPDRERLHAAIAGSAIAIAGARVILIPSEALDDEELRVAQEWVDIPTWRGDYYLAVQINLDEQWARLWGWTTHYQLKTAGHYDYRDRTYSLASEALYLDLSTLWVARELSCSPTQAPVAELPTLDPVQAENAIARLSNPQLVWPRLEVPFPLWGALLADRDWRDRLLRQRLGETATASVQLRRWLDERAAAGWQSLETAFVPTAWALRDRHSPEITIRRVKAIVLDTEPPTEVMLLLSVSESDDDRFSVSIRLHPHRDCTLLPEGIALDLLSPAGESFRSVVARDRDNYIQIPRFKCPPGFNFAICVRLEDATVTEEFMA
jgi:hypothetical protein